MLFKNLLIESPAGDCSRQPERKIKMRLISSRVRKNLQSGFSLIEILIAMVVMMIILGAAFALMRGSIISGKANSELVNLQQNLRFSMAKINEDLLSAGDGISGVSKIWLGKDFVTTHISAKNFDSTLGDFYNPNYALMSVITADDNIAAPKDTIPSLTENSNITIVNGSDRLTLLSLNQDFDPVQISAGNANGAAGAPPVAGGQLRVPQNIAQNAAIGEIFYLSNGEYACFGEVTDKNNTDAITLAGDGLFQINGSSPNGQTPLEQVGNAPGRPLMLQKVRLITYFLGQDGILRRRVFGDGPLGTADARDDIIATNSTGLKFNYISRTDDQNKVFGAPQAELASYDERNSVVSVIATIKGLTDALENGQRSEQTMTSIINIRNLPYGLSAAPVDTAGNSKRDVCDIYPNSLECTCSRYPTAQGCPGDPCRNLTGQDLSCCRTSTNSGCQNDPCKDPTTPGCPGDPCKDLTGTDQTCCYSPTSRGCAADSCKDLTGADQDCCYNSYGSGCENDPCKTYPTLPGCPGDTCKDLTGADRTCCYYPYLDFCSPDNPCKYLTGKEATCCYIPTYEGCSGDPCNGKTGDEYTCCRNPQLCQDNGGNDGAKPR